MKYVFELNSRMVLSEPAESKHANIVERLKATPKPWGIDEELSIPFPEFGDTVALARLSKYLGAGIKMDVMYRYRNNPEDHHSSDDRIFIEFSSKAVDFQYLTETIFPIFVKMFNPYSAAVYNEALIYEDFDKSRNQNGRKSVYRFYPIAFYDEELCKNLFSMSPATLLKKLNGQVDQAKLFNGGVMIIADVKPLSVFESNLFDEKMRLLLTPKAPESSFLNWIKKLKK